MEKKDTQMHDEANVLLVEDNLTDVLHMQQLLEREEASWLKMKNCDSISAALHSIKQEAPDVVLLDLTLPDSSELSGLVKLRKHSISVPILVLAEEDNQELATRALKMGAHDYLVKKNINSRALLRIIEYAILRNRAEIYKTRLILMEQREEFMAALTHDLKNPLLGANRILEHLLDGRLGRLNNEQFQILEMLKDSNKSLLNMVHNLIDVYRHKRDTTSLFYEKVDVSEVVSTCLSEFVPHARARNVAISNTQTRIPLFIEADSNSCRRVIHNLLDNALKFTPAGGSINIRIGGNSSRALLEIEDTGTGMSADEISTLFRPFRQGVEGKKYSPGTGLGLYLCKQIVEAHKGQIECASELGKGTTFTVSLPVRQGKKLIKKTSGQLFH